MAQPQTILVDVDLTLVRRKVKLIMREAQEVNRELAALEDRLDTLGARLAHYGIGLRIGEHS